MIGWMLADVGKVSDVLDRCGVYLLSLNMQSIFTKGQQVPLQQHHVAGHNAPIQPNKTGALTHVLLELAARQNLPLHK